MKAGVTDILILGRPKQPPNLRAELERAIKLVGSPASVRSGFAYATQAGADALFAALETSEGWRRARKRWIFGVHHGITEPLVVRQLRALPNSKVRLFTGGEGLRSSTLTHGPRFHAKVLCVAELKNGRPRPHLLAATSANLTGAALGLSARNYEAGVQLRSGAIGEGDIRRFDAWWSEAWGMSLDATDTAIGKYASLRDRFLQRNPDAASQLDPPSPERIGDADVLWIEAGAMSGGSRNQVEFSAELATYFGDREKGSRKLLIRARGKTWDDRPLSYKKTTFGVDIWRLSLPTRAQGAHCDYPGNVICLKRSGKNGTQAFELDVAAPGTRRHRRWYLASNRGGYVGVTSGNREFGFC